MKSETLHTIAERYNIPPFFVRDYNKYIVHQRGQKSSDHAFVGRENAILIRS